MDKQSLKTKQKGVITELQCITYFYELGYPVSIPYGDNSRYDFIVDIDGCLLRIQVKTSRELDDGNVIEFSCRSTRVNSGGAVYRRYTSDEIDYFATYYKNECYLVPVQECAVNKKLRINPAKNNQKSCINLAEDYRADIQIKELLSLRQAFNQ